MIDKSLKHLVIFERPGPPGRALDDAPFFEIRTASTGFGVLCVPNTEPCSDECCIDMADELYPQSQRCIYYLRNKTHADMKRRIASGDKKHNRAMMNIDIVGFIQDTLGRQWGPHFVIKFLADLQWINEIRNLPTSNWHPSSGFASDHCNLVVVNDWLAPSRYTSVIPLSYLRREQRYSSYCTVVYRLDGIEAVKNGQLFNTFIGEAKTITFDFTRSGPECAPKDLAQQLASRSTSDTAEEAGPTPIHQLVQYVARHVNENIVNEIMGSKLVIVGEPDRDWFDPLWSTRPHTRNKAPTQARPVYHLLRTTVRLLPGALPFTSVALLSCWTSSATLWVCQATDTSGL